MSCDNCRYSFGIFCVYGFLHPRSKKTCKYEKKEGAAVIYPSLECPKCKKKKMKLVPIIVSKLIDVDTHERCARLGVRCQHCGYIATLEREQP